ncbi:YALIA101S02e03356g1_1 [Yarrowia lipolytica]|nr:Putative U3 small nucleolar RNA-associated protein 13 [Yarrowia lipolytica]SEI31842.1 YALIA101S02e03356g1_1 [Yarrowia lipolytica]
METTEKTAFEAVSVEPFYTGGKTSLADDGYTLATSFGEDVVVTNIKTGEEICRIEGDSEILTTLEISPDAQYLVTCSRSLTMRTYRIPSGELVRSARAHDAPVIVMAIDSSSSLVATGGAEGTVKVWDLERGFVTHNLKGHGGVVSALKFFGEQGSSVWRLASGADDCKIRVWDLVSRKCLKVLDSHNSVIRGLSWSSDGGILVSGGRDKIVNVWDANKFKLVRTIPVGESIETAGILNGEGLRIYTGGEMGVVKIWNGQTSALIAAQVQPAVHNKENERVGVVDILYKTDKLVSVLSDQTFVELDDDLKEVRRIVGFHDQIIDMTYVGEDESKLAVVTNAPDIRIQTVGGIETNVLTGHRDNVIAVDRSFDGTWLASSGKDHEARIWHVPTLTCFAVCTGHAGSVGGVALPRLPLEGRPPQFLITGSQDLTIKKWNIAKDGTAKAEYTRKAHEKDINALDVSPNDRLFATASQDRTAKVWDMNSGEAVGVLRGHKRGVWSIKFNPYEKQIVTGSGDKTVKVWSLNDFSCLRTFEGHTNSVLRTVWTSLGSQIVSSGGDGLIKVWTYASGECAVTLDNHEDKVWSLAVRGSDDGAQMVSGDGEGTITVWKDISDEEKAAKKAAAELQVEQEQQLANYVRSKDWENAILLALTLNQPYKLFCLFRDVLADRQDEDSIMGLTKVDNVIAGLNVEQLELLIKRVRDWNTNARSSVVAQRVMNCILVNHSVDKLSQVPKISTMTDALIPYSERHFNRVDEMYDESYLLDYALNEMDFLDTPQVVS